MHYQKQNGEQFGCLILVLLRLNKNEVFEVPKHLYWLVVSTIRDYFVGILYYFKSDAMG